jgi:hypothetical protein
VLKAAREEVGSFPVAQTNDVAHVSEVVRKAMECGSKIAREGAKPGGLEGAGKGTRELAADKHGWRILSA